MKPNKPLKAYSVQGNEYGVIEFAHHSVVARRNGANELNIEFGDVESCTRVPVLDRYAGVKRGVPMRVLVEEHDWSQECGYCERRVYNDSPDRVWVTDELACCSRECAEMRAKRHADLGVSEAVDAVLHPGRHRIRWSCHTSGVPGVVLFRADMGSRGVAARAVNVDLILQAVDPVGAFQRELDNTIVGWRDPV